MNLPLNQPASQQDSRWKSLLDPVLENPILSGHQIDNLLLASGDNVINHGLGRALQGYFIVLNNSAVTFHDKQASNSSPQLTLVLTASGAATVSLWVY